MKIKVAGVIIRLDPVGAIVRMIEEAIDKKIAKDNELVDCEQCRGEGYRRENPMTSYAPMSPMSGEQFMSLSQYWNKPENQIKHYCPYCHGKGKLTRKDKRKYGATSEFRIMTEEQVNKINKYPCTGRYIHMGSKVTIYHKFTGERLDGTLVWSLFGDNPTYISKVDGIEGYVVTDYLDTVPYNQPQDERVQQTIVFER